MCSTTNIALAWFKSLTINLANVIVLSIAVFALSVRAKNRMSTGTKMFNVHAIYTCRRDKHDHYRFYSSTLHTTIITREIAKVRTGICVILNRNLTHI